MPYTLSWEDGGVYKHFTGDVSFDEYARSQVEVLADRRTDDLRYVINDLLDIDGYSVTRDQAEYAAAYSHGPHLSNPRMRIAWITRDAKLVLMIKMVAVFAAYPIQVFPSIDAAREWLAGAH